jgi:hypothetical protein
MSKALEERSTDMIGLARPLVAEPRFCADLLAKRTSAAKPNLVEESLQSGAAIRQIPVIANGHEPQDLSDPRIAKEMEAELRGGKKNVDHQEKKDLTSQVDHKPYPADA